MAKSTVKIGPEIDKKLYAEFCRVAKENCLSQRFLLEKALEHYIQFVIPSRSTVRRKVMAHFRRSTGKNRKLHLLLAR